MCIPDIDDCEPGHCKNGATCTDRVNGYICTCAPGWDGFNCTISKLNIHCLNDSNAPLV